MAYGPTSLDYISLPPESRKVDPFNLLFPKMTKCYIETYGPSGSVQKFDSLCVLTINVFNEKLYLMIWFILVVLSVVAGLYALVEIVLLSCPPLRKRLLLTYVLPDRPELKRKLTRILNMTGFGDWMMMYMMAVNLDRVMFTDIVDGIEYPDYNWNAEPLDQENMALRKHHEMPSGDLPAAAATEGNLDMNQRQDISFKKAGRKLLLLQNQQRQTT